MNAGTFEEATYPLSAEATVSQIEELIQSHNFDTDPILTIIDDPLFAFQMYSDAKSIHGVIKTGNLTLSPDDSHRYNRAYVRLLKALKNINDQTTV